MEENHKTLSEIAVEHFGAEHQKRKAIEEMGELITALSREKDGRATKGDIITEIADVCIMMRQLLLIYGEKECLSEIGRKSLRLMTRIEKEKLKNGKTS